MVSILDQLKKNINCRWFFFTKKEILRVRVRVKVYFKETM